MTTNYVKVYEEIIVTEDASWVIFENGTCVVFKNPDPKLDLKEEAIKLLKEWGPVVPGTSAGDFNITTLTQHPGWIVTCHHPDIINYVSPTDFDEKQLVGEVNIGLFGRSMRDTDAKSLKVIHVQKN